MKISFVLVAVSLFCTHSNAADDSTKTIDTITIQDVVYEGIGASVSKQNKLSNSKVENSSSSTFAESIDQAPGVSTLTSCAFCGSKRVSLNGLRGEHTSILTDGLPLHSHISSLYSMDAIPTEVIDTAEIYRGPGQSQFYAEAIGGVINLQPKSPSEINSSRLRLTGSSNKDLKTSLTNNHKINDHVKLLTALSMFKKQHIDLDKNGVSESPQQNGKSIYANLFWSPDTINSAQVYVNYFELNNIGGSTQNYTSKAPPSRLAEADNFINQDVRNKFIGTQDQISDSIQLKRWQTGLKWEHLLDDDTSWTQKMGWARQTQDNIYSHGYDYSNKDDLLALQSLYQKSVNLQNFIETGLDFKFESMNSKSKELYQNLRLKKDDIISNSAALFFQNTWTPSETIEWTQGVRLESTKTEWTAFNKAINQTYLSPRTKLKLHHAHGYESEIHWGLGHRTPLSLFESQHGTDHYGFEIAINKIEKSETFGYGLSHSTDSQFIYTGITATQLTNMAYGQDRASQELPVLFKNSTEKYNLLFYEITWQKEWLSNFKTELRLEHNHMPNGYKEKLPVAAIETQAELTNTFNYNDIESSVKINFVASRDLSKYGYSSHYNRVYEDQYLDLHTESQKWQTAPAFVTIDFDSNYSISRDLKLTAAITNIFDYTQTKAGDSPTTWALHGLHYHLDNFHLWGPTESRKLWLTITYEL